MQITEMSKGLITVIIRAGTLVPGSINGDIAIQREWSKFDPSQNPNPLADYDETFHNWLRLRDERVTQNLCQSAVRERLAKYVKYKASFSFLFFSRTRLLKWPVHGFWRKKAQCTRCDVRKCLLGSTRWPTFWGSNSPKPSKLGINMHCRASQLRVNEDWRHRRMTSLALCSVVN